MSLTHINGDDKMVNSIQGYSGLTRHYGLRFSDDIIEQVRKYSQLFCKRLIKAGLNVYDISETETETPILGLLVTDVPPRRYNDANRLPLTADPIDCRLTE